MRARKTKIVVTLGPATAGLDALFKLAARGVDFVRTNMSHSSLADLREAMCLARRAGIPFIIDTEGAQVRTGDLAGETLHFEQDREVRLAGGPVDGPAADLLLRPASVLEQLEPGDLIHIDFDTLVLRVTGRRRGETGVVRARVVAGGRMGRNKAVVIDPVLKRRLDLPALSEKDRASIAIGLEEGAGHVALSYVRSPEAIDEVREITGDRMSIISKIECAEALEQIDEIIERSDHLLIDRGDLSKEIPVERIPFVQKIVIERARRRGVGVFVATNLLETMIEHRKPTRAEVQDIVNTIVDGATGLTLAAETAIGKHPMECVNMLNRLIAHAETVLPRSAGGADEGARGVVTLPASLADSGYLRERDGWSSLVPPHGGRLVDRMSETPPAPEELHGLERVMLERRHQMELEQIAMGTYSPLEGFMGSADLDSVLGDMRLQSGVLWPVPVLLDVSDEVAARLSAGEEIALTDRHGRVVGLMELEEIHRADPRRIAQRLYGTTSRRHPGARRTLGMRPALLAGRITLIRRRRSVTASYEMSPRQTRRLFQERGWVKVLGVHTREVVQREHELVQLEAMERLSCDGLFVHPLIGDRRRGDIRPTYVIRSYERIVEQFYPRDRVLVAALSTFSRHADWRETIFAALCRQNFGCSHFIGGDASGAGDGHDDLAITILRPEDVRPPGRPSAGAEQETIPAPRLLAEGRMPPPVVMRQEISRMILDAVSAGERVFV